MEDQARAVSRLIWQHIGSVSRYTGGHCKSTDDTTIADPEPSKKVATPWESMTYDTLCPLLTFPDVEYHQAEGTGVEPQGDFPNCLYYNNLQQYRAPRSVNWQHLAESSQDQLSTGIINRRDDSTLGYIAAAWPHLPPDVRETILTLVRNKGTIDRLETSGM